MAVRRSSKRCGFDEGPLDHAERLCLQAGRLSVEELRRVGIITRPHDSRVRLVKRDELLEGWSPATDTTPSVWELLQHVLAQFLSKDSERGAAALLRQRPSAMADTQELAYWLFRAVERTRAEEARQIDLLLTSWPASKNSSPPNNPSKINSSTSVRWRADAPPQPRR